MSIHQEAVIAASPKEVYAVLVDADRLSMLSGMHGDPGLAEGDAFAAFDNHVIGRQIELGADSFIVQAWRFPAWEQGVYSIVRFSVEPSGTVTRLIIDQHGEPTDWHDHIDINWPTFYLDPLRRAFSTAGADGLVSAGSGA